jgi:hypothetical protein
MWAGHTSHTDLRIEDSAHFQACNPGNLVWPKSSFALVELVEKDFTLRPAQANAFCWK